jgi:hypothetical protein
LTPTQKKEKSHYLDTHPEKGEISLRDMCFDLKTTTGVNLFVDVDNATRSGETVFHVKKEHKQEAMRSIELWIKSNFHLQIKWNNALQFDAKTYRLDAKSRSLASQFTDIANETTQSSNNLKPPPSAQLPKSTPAINGWIDLTRVREPPEKPFATTHGKDQTEDEATVTTLSESTWNSTTLPKAEIMEKFKKIGSNLRNLSYRHKKLESGQESLEMFAALRINQLSRCFELHHNRLERLEAARDRHAEIQLQHIQFTLDPVSAQKNGTLAKLEKLITNEIRQASDDRRALEEDTNRSLDEPHEDDIEFLERQAVAGRLFDYFHKKIETNNDADSFNIDTISEVSYGEYNGDTLGGEKVETQTALSEDDAMETDTEGNQFQDTNPVTHQGTLPASINSEHHSPPTTPIQVPTSWGSEDEDDNPDHPYSSPKPTSQWTTTPSRSDQMNNSTASSMRTNLSESRFPASKKGARKLFQRAFPPKDSFNRFSALEEDTVKIEEHDASKALTNTVVTNQDHDQSIQDSDYTDNDGSEDDSLDAMSLVSGSVINGLEGDLREYDDEGYDTETTDNTSPSHKRQKQSRSASRRAQERIADVHASSIESDTLLDRPLAEHLRPQLHTQPSPHPSLNTTPKSEGHGAPTT